MNFPDYLPKEWQEFVKSKELIEACKRAYDEGNKILISGEYDEKRMQTKRTRESNSGRTMHPDD